MDDIDFQYRKLIVWQKAMQFTKVVYSLVKQIPEIEKYALTDQIRRAVVSIPSNIAEGCGRATNRDYAHFLSISRGSLYETMTQLEVAQSLGYVGPISDAESLAAEISRMLTSLMKKYIPLSNSNS
jgi:four helix bundle protein